MTVTNKILVAFMVGLGVFFSLGVFLDAWRQVGHDDRSATLAASLGWMIAVALAVVATGLVLRRNGSDQRILPLSIGVTLLLIVAGRVAFESLHAAGQAQAALAVVGLLIGGLVLVISGPTAPSGPKSGSAFPPSEPPRGRAQEAPAMRKGGGSADLAPAGNGRYRTWHRAVLHMIVMTPGIALCVPLGVSVLADPDDLESLLFGLAFLIGGLALAVGLWRVIGACLLVQDGGVVVRTEWRSRSWRWDEVAEFFVPTDSSMLFVRTVDGSEVPVPGVSGLRPALFPRARDRFTLLATELNLRLERERTPPGERPSGPVAGPR